MLPHRRADPRARDLGTQLLTVEHAMKSTPPHRVPEPTDRSESSDIARHLKDVEYPLTLSFKVLALSAQVTVTDVRGRVVLHTKQKLFSFREKIEVFTDTSRSVLLAKVEANKVIDWSARYFASDAFMAPIGSVGRRGWRSLWRAHYEVFNPGDHLPDFTIREANAWAKVGDSLLQQIPVIGILSAYLFHPQYLASRADGALAMRMTKLPAFFEGRFQLDRLGELSAREELNLILAFLMMVILERRRG